MTSHRPLVVALAGRRRSLGWAARDDLVQEGCLGLIKAAEHFDPRKGAFPTYARWWVRAYLDRWCANRHAHDGEPGLLEGLAAPEADPEAACLAVERDRAVRSAVERLRRRLGRLGLDIVHSRLCADPPETLEAIGRRWRVSRERVRQVEQRSKQLLAREFRAGESSV